MAIDRLTAVQTLTEADQVALYSVDVGVDCRTPLSVLAAYLATLLTIPQAFETQYAAPTSTGFTVTVDPTEDGSNVFLLLTPAAGYAAGTIMLPAQSEVIDGQEVMCTCTAAVTTLTVNGNGATVVGAPTTLAANAFFKVRYDGVNLKWYRVA